MSVMPNSNTTPVTVQPEFACYCSPHNIIQIQHLLLFNKIAEEYYSTALFKYNTCYCSTKKELSRLAYSQDSNTILVTVQLSPATPILQSNGHSNTILVTVQPRLRFFLPNIDSIQIQYLLLFNGSAVIQKNLVRDIQIQYLLLFNRYLIWDNQWFNWFKYNTCYCSTNGCHFGQPRQLNSNTILVTVQQ